MNPRAFAAAIFLTLGSVAFTQGILTTIVSNLDPGTMAERIAEAQRYAQTIENAIQQLQTADQALQYQITALQQLSTGTWDGFVKAWDAETGVLNDYSNFMAQLPSLSQIQAVNDYVDSQGYQASMANIQQLQKQWGLASNIVHTTDTLVQDTKTRQALWENTLASSANNQSPVAQLQVLNQALGLMGGEVRDLNVNMGAWKAYFVAQVEQQQLEDKIIAQQADDFMFGDAADSIPLDSGSVGDLDKQYTGISD